MASRSDGPPYRIAVVCLGNICRSPIAEAVLTERIRAAGLGDEVEVVSAGMGGWHVGNPMDRRAAAVLTAHGYDASRHRARQFAPSWFEDCDLVLAMDEGNLDEIAELAGSPEPSRADAPQVAMFRDFDPDAHDDDRDVPDPYFGGDDGFDSVLSMVERTASALVESLARRRAGS